MIFFFFKSELVNSHEGHKNKCKLLHLGENDLMLSTNWVRKKYIDFKSGEIITKKIIKKKTKKQMNKKTPLPLLHSLELSTVSSLFWDMKYWLQEVGVLL